MRTSQDTLLKVIADNASLTVVSIGYRLAPEHPFPAGPNDCYDVAEFLVDHGAREFGSDLKFAGGEVRINFHMRRQWRATLG